MLDKGEFPQARITGLTVPTTKGGDPNNPENYRRVTILPILGKLFETLVNIRLVFLKDALCQHDTFNGGFKKGSITSDNIFVLLGCSQKAQAMDEPEYVWFVDFKRAFDTVNRRMMFFKLMKRGIEGKCVHLLQNVYIKAKMKVCVNNVLSHLITDETGVNQGGPNSPDMFVDFLSDLRKYLDEQCGIVVDECVLLHLPWADDLIIVPNSA